MCSSVAQWVKAPIIALCASRSVFEPRLDFIAGFYFPTFGGGGFVCFFGI